MPSNIGTVQTLLVCSTEQSDNLVPMSSSTNAGDQVLLCPNGTRLYSTQAYVISASQQQAIDAAMAPFDYGYASALWSLAFTTVVGLWLVSHGIGVVLGFIRRG